MSTAFDSQNLLKLRLENEEETEALAARFARALTKLEDPISQSGFNLRLTGDLGAGKTTFTRALLRALGFTGRVKSPTFELLNEYPVFGATTLRHFDFYRFEAPVEFEEAGFRDLFGPGAICVTEWSNKADPYLPKADLEMTLCIEGLSRDASIACFSELGKSFLKTLQEDGA